jgi:hypothetical protein
VFDHLAGADEIGLLFHGLLLGCFRIMREVGGLRRRRVFGKTAKNLARYPFFKVFGAEKAGGINPVFRVWTLGLDHKLKRAARFWPGTGVYDSDDTGGSICCGAGFTSSPKFGAPAAAAGVSSQ